MAKYVFFVFCSKQLGTTEYYNMPQNPSKSPEGDLSNNKNSVTGPPITPLGEQGGGQLHS